MKKLQDGGVAVLLLNRGAAGQTITVNWPELELPADSAVSARDLWQHRDLGKLTGKFSAPIPSHGSVMLTLRP